MKEKRKEKDNVKKKWFWILVVCLFFLVGLFAFRCVLGEDRIFSASDSNIGLLARSKALPPSGFFGYFFSAPIHGTSGSKVPSFGTFLFHLSSIEFFNNWRYMLYLLVSTVSLIGFLRLRRISRIGSVLGSLVAFWVGSVTMASAGHDGKFAVAMFFSASLFLIEKMVQQSARWRRACYAVLCGGTIGCMLLEQQDIGLLFGLMLGFYAVFRLIQQFGRDWSAWFLTLIPIAVIGLLIVAPTAQHSYEKNIKQAASVQSGDVEKWNYITQWSFPPREMLDLVSPGFFGWKTGDPSGPYWGVCGQSAEWEKNRQGFQNFRLDSTYIGLFPFALALLGLGHCFGRRSNRVWVCFWNIAAVVSLMLAFGKFSFAYKIFYQLPLVNNIRAPIKFLHVFQIIIGILCGIGWDAFRELSGNRKIMKRLSVAFFSVSALFLLGGVIVWLGKGAVEASLIAQGWGDSASVIASRMSSALLHSGAVSLPMGGALFLLWIKPELGRKPALWACLGLLFFGVVLGDVYLLTGKYFHSTSYGNLRKGNVVINHLKSVQGNQRIFFFDTGNVYNQWLAQNVPYHQLNVFNIWQMPRMPSDYKAYLGSVGKNWFRLLQLSSVEYALSPAALLNKLPQDAFDPIMFYRFIRVGDGVGTQQIMRPEHKNDQAILHFKQGLSRFSLFSSWELVASGSENSVLVSPSFDPLMTLVVTQDEASVALPLLPVGGSVCQACPGVVNGVSAELDVDSPGGVLLFTQHYQLGWRVFVNGQKQPLLRCNSINMGVYLPKGMHRVQFICPKNYGGFLIQAIGFIGAFFAGTALLIAHFKTGVKPNR